MILEWHDKFNPGDIAWMAGATIAILVLLGPGFLLFYGGLRDWREPAGRPVRWLGLLAVLSIAWCLWIYTLAFGPSWGTVPELDLDEPSPVATDFQSMMQAAHDAEDTTEEQGRGGLIGGTEYAVLQGVPPRAGYPRSVYPTRRPAHHVPHALFLMFQLAVFVAYSAPLLGVLVDRVPWSGVAAFAVLWGTLIYAPLAHWIWGEGWLAAIGALDASGGLLHVGVGFSALTAALVLGRAEPAESPPFDDALATASAASVAGAAVTWAALLLAHAALMLTADARAAAAVLNSHLAATAGLLSWYVAARLLGTQTSRDLSHTGAIAGLAAIAPGCGLVMPQSALIVGVAAGAAGALTLSALGSRLPRRTGYSIFAVQGITAAAGMILTGVFATSAAAGFDRHGEAIEGLVAGDLSRLTAQGIALGAAALLAVVGTLLIAGGIRFFCAKN